MAVIRIERGPGAGNTYLIESEAVIGRDPSQATICIPDSKVSSKHAFIFQKNNRYYIEDHGSKNKTYVNGRPVEKRTPLEPGDYISLGYSWLFFGEELEIERINKELPKYEILQKTDEIGGIAHHFRVRQIGLDRIVNAYLLPPNIIRAHPHLKKKFRLQARALAKLNHENIAIMLDFEAKESYLFLTTEYVEGETLSSLLKKKKEFSLEQAVEIGRGIARGLAHAHSQGTIHQDISPNNILLSGKRVILGGFGVAPVLFDVKERYSSLISRAEYVSPEQINRREIDYRSDIYSLGVVLHELLAGRPPFAGKDPEEIMEAHLHNTPPALTNYNPNVPAELEKLVYHCLEKEKESRPQDTEWLANSLDGILSKQKVLNLTKHPNVYTSTTLFYLVKGLSIPYLTWGLLPIVSLLGLTILYFSQ